MEYLVAIALLAFVTGLLLVVYEAVNHKKNTKSKHV